MLPNHRSGKGTSSSLEGTFFHVQQAVVAGLVHGSGALQEVLAAGSILRAHRHLKQVLKGLQVKLQELPL